MENNNETSWEEKGGLLVKIFQYPDFSAALQFVNSVGELAEKHQHHPDISIFNYNQVLISLTTHDAGSTVTEKDFQLAAKIDALG